MTILLGDLHFEPKELNIKRGTDFFNNYIIRNKKYKNIICMGDIFTDKRKLDVYMLNKIKKEIFEKLTDRKIYIILGNHDIYYKEDNSINSVELLESMFDNIYVIKKDEIIEIENIKYYCIPYGFIPDKNKMKESDYVLGHIEFYPYYPYSKLDIEEYKKYNKNILMGHLHKKTFDEENKIFPYMGTPYSLNFNDLDDIKGYIEIKNKNNFAFIENKINDYFISVRIKENKINFNKKIKELLIFENIKDINDFLENIEILKKHHFRFFVDNEEKYIKFFNQLEENNIDFHIRREENQLNENEDDEFDDSLKMKDYKDIIKENLNSEENLFFEKVYQKYLQEKENLL